MNRTPITKLPLECQIDVHVLHIETPTKKHATIPRMWIRHVILTTVDTNRISDEAIADRRHLVLFVRFHRAIAPMPETLIVRHNHSHHRHSMVVVLHLITTVTIIQRIIPIITIIIHPTVVAATTTVRTMHPLLLTCTKHHLDVACLVAIVAVAANDVIDRRTIERNIVAAVASIRVVVDRIRIRDTIDIEIVREVD